MATIAAPGAGVYAVEVTTIQAGTVDPLNLADMELRHGGTVVGKVPSTAVATDSTFTRVTVAAAESLTINATAQPAAAAVFVAALRVTRVA